jgi:cytoskeletal protein CcmA (bactofilin family)
MIKEDNRELNTIIGKGSVINGKISIQNSVRIEGRVVGEVSSTGTVTIGSKGEVEGDIVAINAVIGGKVKGSIKASEKIILESNSVLVGDLQTVKLTIDEGAMFEGKCYMSDEKEETEKVVKSESQ